MFSQHLTAQYNGYRWCVYQEDEHGASYFRHFTSAGRHTGTNGTEYAVIHDDDRGTNYYCRSEGGKILRYDTDSGQEFTVCDFSLQKGEEFTSVDGRHYVVDTATDTIVRHPLTNEEKNYRLLKLHNTDAPEDCDQWLENVGSMKNVICLPDEMGNQRNARMLMWWNENWNIPTVSNDISMPRMKGCIMNVEFTPSDWDDGADSIHCEFSKDTLIVSGRLSYWASTRPYLSCVSNGGNITFIDDTSASPLISGYSTLYFTNKFPGFNKGKYRFYHNSTRQDLVCPDGLEAEEDNNTESRFSTIPQTGPARPVFKQWKLVITDNQESQVWKGKGGYVSILTDPQHPDTVVGDRSYVPLTVNTSDTSMTVLLRQENDKIYRYSDEEEGEYIVCDFSLKEGERFVRHDGTVLRVEHVGIASEYPPFWGAYDNDRKLVRLQQEGGGPADVWIEGVGSVFTAILDPKVLSGHNTHVHHVTYDYEYNPTLNVRDAILFHVEKGAFKSVSAFAEKIHTLEDVRKYPEHEYADYTELMEFKGDTLHLSGFYYTGSPLLMLDAWTDGNIINIGFDGILPGDASTAHRFDVRLPGFRSGTYTVRFGVQPEQNLVCGNGINTATGDVNGDGDTDISDIVAVINVIAGTDITTKADVNGDGKVDISDIVAIINIIAKVEKDPTVKAGLCPDSRHPHAIDMGNGLKVACCNLGADAPWEYGDYYAWGETEPKESYRWEDYVHSEEPTSCAGLGDDIAGTSFDAAYTLWGKPWRTPSTAQAWLLKDNCQFRQARINNVTGTLCTAPNGNSIFLPAGGEKEQELNRDGAYGYYWLSNPLTEKTVQDNKLNSGMEKTTSFCFIFDTYYTYISYLKRWNGANIRPIME